MTQRRAVMKAPPLQLALPLLVPLSVLLQPSTSVVVGVSAQSFSFGEYRGCVAKSTGTGIQDYSSTSLCCGSGSYVGLYDSCVLGLTIVNALCTTKCVCLDNMPALSGTFSCQPCSANSDRNCGESGQNDMAIYAIVKAGSGGGGGGDVPQTTSQVAPVDPTTQRAVTSTTQNPPAQTSSQDPGSLPVAGGPPTTSQNDQTDSAGSVPSTGMAGSRTGDSSSVPASTAKDSRSQSLTATSQKGGSVVGSPTAPAGTGTTSGPNQSANTPGSINTDGGGSGVNTTAIVAGTVAAFLFLLLLSCCVVVATRGRNKEEQSPFESGGRMRSNSGAPLLLIEKADSAEDSHATFTMQNADSYANYSLGYGGFYGKSELLIPGELYGESTERGVMMLSSTRTPTPPAAVLSAGYGISASAAAASLRRGEDPFQTYASLSMIRSRSGSMRSQSSQSSIGPDGTLLLSAEAEAAYTLARPIPSTAEAVMHRKSLAYTVRKTEPASYDDDDSEAARVQPVS